MSFSMMASAAALAALVLGLGFLFASPFMLKRWGLAPSDGAQVLGRRIGAVYLGLSLLFLLGRQAPPSDLRSAVCAGLALALALLACLGLFEFSRKRVTAGIAVSIVIEIALATGFAWVYLHP
jgi:hypothetical protein